MQIKYNSEGTEVGLFYNASEPTRGREDSAMGGGVYLFFIRFLDPGIKPWNG